MDLTDLQSLEKWTDFEKEINERYDLDSNVFNTDGIRITEHKAWVNKLCPEIKATDKGQSFICAVAHMNLATMAKNSSKAVVEECDAGIVKIVIPIFAASTFIGVVGACGKCLEDREVEIFLINRITGIEEDKIEALSRDIDTVSDETIQSLITFVEDKIQQINEQFEIRNTNT